MLHNTKYGNTGYCTTVFGNTICKDISTYKKSKKNLFAYGLFMDFNKL